MKLLLDHNLSPKLVKQLDTLYPGSSHVALLGLDRAADIDVWDRAKHDGYCLLTKDADFNELLASKGFPPKVIWIRIGNCTTAALTSLLQSQHPAITAFIENENAGLLELL